MADQGGNKEADDEARLSAALGILKDSGVLNTDAKLGDILDATFKLRGDGKYAPELVVVYDSNKWGLILK